MKAVTLDSQIKKSLPLLGDDEKRSLLSVIKSFLTLKDLDASHPNGPRLTIEQYNKELKDAEARIDAGEFYTKEEVEEMAKKW